MSVSKAAFAKLAKSGWTHKGRKLAKNYQFENFNDAFAFMTRCALDIAKLDHHPEWLNSYNKIEVKLTTHDAGGVTAKDVELAGLMDKIAASYKKKVK